MPRPLKRGILGASTIILAKDIDKYAFMCGSNFYETDFICLKWYTTEKNQATSQKSLVCITTMVSQSVEWFWWLNCFGGKPKIRC